MSFLEWNMFKLSYWKWVFGLNNDYDYLIPDDAECANCGHMKKDHGGCCP